MSDVRWRKEIEKSLVEQWEKEGLFKFNFDPSKPVLVIDTPPPYISGKPHVGQVAHYIQIDMVARAFRMLGYNVLVPFYADRNGLPVEVFVERTYGVNPHEVAKTVEGRESFLDLCKKHLDNVEKEFISLWRALGCSFEYWRNGTDSEEYRKITQSTFIELWRRGLIYEAERPVLWCPRCGTSLAEAEIEYKEEDAELYYIKFHLKDGGEVVIATTRPELLASCLILAYNPNDSRYKHLRNKKAIVPLYNHEIDIIEHLSVDPLFGTGIMMICSYGDQTDVRIVRELGLKPRISIDERGKLVDELLKGLSIRDARKKIVEMLKEKGHILKIEKIKRNVPVCWRCGTPVEIIHMREYFLKQLEFKDAMLKIAKEVKFLPEEHRIKLINWIESISMDWPISKTRYYATEVPVWKCRKCGSILVPEPGKYYRPWKDPPPWDKCPVCGASKNELVGETRVFDTWFDSSISVLYAAGATKYPNVFSMYLRGEAKALRPQGYDIIRTWLYYSLLRVYQLYGKVAFDYIRVSGMGLDEKGEAMHKSKGNVIYPEPYIEKFGADALRFWSAIASKLGSDYRFSEQMIKTGSLFVTKLLNIARFVSAFPIVESVEELHPLDVAILAKLNNVVDVVRKGFENMDFYEPINQIYHFTWDVFADHYLEMVKARAYNVANEYTESEQRSAYFTLHTVLRGILLMLAPIMPFVTDYIWRSMYKNTSIHLETYPNKVPLPGNANELSKLFDIVMNLNSSIWKFKKDRNIRFSEELKATLYLPKELQVFSKDIKNLHKITKIEFGVPEEPYINLGNNCFLKI
ncbi:valine--tRNA ligase [Ignisphaera cupida]|uniref:valine--tRNA ligase n=1 Tax=Ignisphaera cupida TaxID=3050454 RepID=UPI0033077CD6